MKKLLLVVVVLCGCEVSDRDFAHESYTRKQTKPAPAVKQASRLSAENFNQIQIGDSRAKVEGILGTNYDVLYESQATGFFQVRWKEDGTTINIAFKDGFVHSRMRLD